ncbi:hypothetical protein Pint_09130 [Pistacia integerrima]|uniref:Uncharacterized protein n=1 Tax=Pistacia integerrima TaxID=434235 RepID=A0ACC0XTE1_9ROSI|nr:hypothetical protein Pint_09130 [Pistacia integerrima]
MFGLFMILFRVMCSGGMNGYISPCAGDPHPPIFRSPVDGMEDIMGNQVVCAIYKLPDTHKHITRPPAGVIFPEKMVQLDDIKPAPTLWHEDFGRRPYENGRQNPRGTISGRELGEASHRLIVNSLQSKVDHNGYGNHMRGPPVPYAAVPYVPPVPSYHDYRGHDQGHHRIPQPRTDGSPSGNPRSSVPARSYDSGYGQQYSSSTPQPPHRRSHPQYDRNNRSANSGEQPIDLYNPSGIHLNGGPRYPPRPMAQTSGATAYSRQGGYSSIQSYQPPGVGSAHQWGGPQANQSVPRGYGHHQQRGDQNQHYNQQRGNQGYNQNSGNQGHYQNRGNQGHHQYNNPQRVNYSHHQQGGSQYSALDRRPNKGPPPPPPGNSYQ